MIPDQYWQLVRHWYLLIGTCAIIGAVAGLTVLPPTVNSSSSFDARTTLRIANNASLNNIVTSDASSSNSATGAITTEGSVRADYAPLSFSLNPVDAQTLAEYAETPQFISDVRSALEQKNTFLSNETISAMLDASANSLLFRVELRARGNSREDTEEVVVAASALLVARARADEQGVTNRVLANLEQGRAELAARLAELQGTRNAQLQQALAQRGMSIQVRPETLALLSQAPLLTAGASPDLDQELRDAISSLGRVLGDPALVITDLEIGEIQKRLAEVVGSQEGLKVSVTEAGPATVLIPVSTAEVAGSRQMGTLMALLVGGAAGLAIGWIAANLVERALAASSFGAAGQ